MRDYSNIDRYLDKLLGDLYPQPPDPLQTEYAQWIVSNWVDRLIVDKKSVLDVGCGQGFTKPMFNKIGWKWTGVTLGEDYKVCKEKGLEVYEDDFSFLRFKDNSFPLIFSRHSAEHSPFLVLTLMEWRRVSSKYLITIIPNPDGYNGNKELAIGYRGRNHMSVSPKEQFIWLANRAGWKLIEENIIDFEMRFLLEHGEEITE